MSLKHFLGVVGRNTQHHIPTILTVSASIGVVATAILSIKATPKAVILLEERREEIADRMGLEPHSINISSKEVLKISWRPYIPAILMGGATLMCIVGANTVHLRRSAAVLSAYTLTDKAFTEYRDQVKDVFGDKGHEKVQDKVAKALIESNPVDKEVLLDKDETKVLCYDSMSGRYFKANVEDIRKAQNDVNEIILKDMYASQNDFYERIGLRRTELGDMLGWDLDTMIDISFSSTLTVDNQPCLTILYNKYPIQDYYRINS